MLPLRFNMFDKLRLFFIIPISFCLLILTLLIFSISYASDSGWLYQNSYPTSRPLFGVRFVSPDKGWVVGDQGTILYTEDGGNTWELQESMTEMPLSDVFFINDKIGWVVGDIGTILYTENGGKKWIPQGKGLNNYSLYKIFFIDSKEGWSIGCDINRGTVLSTAVLSTLDGGRNWIRVPFNFGQVSGIFFIDAKTGWILSGDKVFRTIDGGKKWEFSLLPVDPAMREIPRLPGDIPMPLRCDRDSIGNVIHFANKKEGWALVKNDVGSQLFYTNDSGKTWRLQFSGAIMPYKSPFVGGPGRGADTGKSYKLLSIFFANNKRGCISGSAVIFCTNDGGATWEKGGSLWLNSGQFVNTNVAWAVEYYVLMKTEDGGKNWVMKNSKSIKVGNMEHIDYTTFINSTTGWGVIGGRIRTSGAIIKTSGTIIKTSDGGDTWETQEKFSMHTIINGSFFINPSTGWLVGWQAEEISHSTEFQNSIILHTKDGGKRWEIQSKEPAEGLAAVFFTDADTGWVVGWKGIIFHTKDGGKTWKPQKSGTKLFLKDICFIDSKRGWVIGGGYTHPDKDISPTQGIILYTEDGGENWDTQWAKKDAWLDGCFFTDFKKGWVTGEGFLFYTEDGGKTWHEKDIPDNKGGHNYHIKRPFFIDANRGWVQVFDLDGDRPIENTLLITEDGGKTWKKHRAQPQRYPWMPFK
mgnify:FL=1